MIKVALAVVEWFVWLIAAIALGAAYPITLPRWTGAPPGQQSPPAVAPAPEPRLVSSNLLRVGAGSRVEAICPQSPATGIHISLQTGCNTPPKVAPTDSL